MSRVVICGVNSMTAWFLCVFNRSSLASGGNRDEQVQVDSDETFETTVLPFQAVLVKVAQHRVRWISRGATVSYLEEIAAG